MKSPTHTDNTKIEAIHNMARLAALSTTLDSIGITDGTAKATLIAMIFEETHYHSPAYHVITVGISLAWTILVVGMATILVLSTAGILG